MNVRLSYLGEIAQINPTARKALDPQMLCSFIPMDNVDEDLGRIVRKQTRLICEVSKGYTPFEERDVLFAKITPCMENGKAAIATGLVNGIGYGTTEFHVLRATEKVSPEWIYHFLRRKSFRIQAEQRMKGSAGQKRVSSEFLEESSIVLPDPKEQAILLRVMNSALNQRRVFQLRIDELNSFLQAVFIQFFGEMELRPASDLVEIGEKIVLSQYGTSKKSNQNGMGIPILGMGNITYSGQLDLKGLSCVELEFDEMDSLRLRAGDIIFNRTNSTDLVGKTSLWTESLDAVLASYLVKLNVDESVHPEYFVGLLNSAYFKRLFRQRCKKAVSQSNISPTLLKEFKMYAPPFDKQLRFAEVAKRCRIVYQRLKESERQAELFWDTLCERIYTEDATFRDAILKSIAR